MLRAQSAPEQPEVVRMRAGALASVRVASMKRVLDLAASLRDVRDIGPAMAELNDMRGRLGSEGMSVLAQGAGGGAREVAVSAGVERAALRRQRASVRSWGVFLRDFFCAPCCGVSRTWQGVAAQRFRKIPAREEFEGSPDYANMLLRWRLGSVLAVVLLAFVALMIFVREGKSEGGIAGLMALAGLVALTGFEFWMFGEYVSEEPLQALCSCCCCATSSSAARHVPLIAKLNDLGGFRAPVVMISYSWGGSPVFARSLAASLGDLAWIDVEQLPNGVRLLREVQTVAIHSAAVVLVVDPWYLTSRNCLAEFFACVALRESLTILHVQRESKKWGGMKDEERRRVEGELEGIAKALGFQFTTEAETLAKVLSTRVLDPESEEDKSKVMKWWRADHKVQRRQIGNWVATQVMPPGYRSLPRWGPWPWAPSGHWRPPERWSPIDAVCQRWSPIDALRSFCALQPSVGAERLAYDWIANDLSARGPTCPFPSLFMVLRVAGTLALVGYAIDRVVAANESFASRWAHADFRHFPHLPVTLLVSALLSVAFFVLLPVVPDFTRRHSPLLRRLFLVSSSHRHSSSARHPNAPTTSPSLDAVVTINNTDGHGDSSSSLDSWLAPSPFLPSSSVRDANVLTLEFITDHLEPARRRAFRRLFWFLHNAGVAVRTNDEDVHRDDDDNEDDGVDGDGEDGDADADVEANRRGGGAAIFASPSRAVRPRAPLEASLSAPLLRLESASAAPAGKKSSFRRKDDESAAAAAAAGSGSLSREGSGKRGRGRDERFTLTNRNSIGIIAIDSVDVAKAYLAARREGDALLPVERHILLVDDDAVRRQPDGESTVSRLLDFIFISFRLDPRTGALRPAVEAPQILPEILRALDQRISFAFQQQEL
jgi:TIR domain